MDRNDYKNKTKKHNCIMVNTSAIWQQAAHNTSHLLAAQQEPYKKA